MTENKPVKRKLRHKIKSDCTTDTFWEKFKDTFKSVNRKVPISRDVYKKIIREYNELIMKEVIEDGKAFKLPFSLGFISVVKRESPLFSASKENIKKHLRPDFGHYNKTGELIYHLNEHSNYYYYHIKWIRPTFTYDGSYHYDAPFDAKRKLAKVIKEKSVDYRLYRKLNIEVNTL